MKKGVNMDSLNTGSVLSVPPLPVLSTSKLGCPYSSRWELDFFTR